MGSFQHRVAHRITRRQPRRRGEGGWEYPTLVVVMEEAGFEEIEEEYGCTIYCNATNSGPL